MPVITFKLGTTARNDAYTGGVGSISIDTNTYQMRIHDGVTVGGHTLAKDSDIGSIQTQLDNLGIEDVDGLTVALAAKLAITQLGANDGVATLNSESLVPTEQLPSFVEDVITVNDFASLPSTGEIGKIYVTADEGVLYRWSGTSEVYTAISADITNTDDLSEGQVNLYYTDTRTRGVISVSGDLAYLWITGELSFTESVSSANGEVGEVVLDKSHLSLGNLENYGIANQEEAELTTVSNKYVTPIRARNFVEYMGFVEDVEWGISGGVMPSTGAGGANLLYGDESLGYYGEVSEGDFISQSALITDLSFTEGSDFNWSDDLATFSWLKFSHNGKVLFIPKKPIKYGVPWSEIYDNGLVYGVDGDGTHPHQGVGVNQLRTVTIGDDSYIVRLPTGFNVDPNDVGATNVVTHPNNIAGSEWYELMVRVHTETEFSGDPAYDSYPLGEWEQFTSTELNVGSAAQAAGSWVQEAPTDLNYRTNLGRFSITTAVCPFDHEPHVLYGWRPVLELVV